MLLPLPYTFRKNVYTDKYTALKIRTPFDRLRGLLLLSPDWQVRKGPNRGGADS